MSKPRLLLLCEYPTLNGGEHSMLSTLAAVQEAGFDLVVAAPPEGTLRAELESRGIEVVPLSSLDANGMRLSQDERRCRLATLLAKTRPDLVHANSLSMARLSGPVTADLKIPSIGHLRDIIKLSRRAISDVSLHTRVLAVSEATRAFHVAQGLEPDRSFVQHNGVDLTAFRPRPATGYLHKELSLPTDTPLIATIGQIGLRKGHDVFAQAACDILGRRPRAQFLVVGERFSDKEESRAFEANLRAAARGPLDGHLHLVGFRNDMAELLNELTLLVHPARQEPLGRVLLESAASGVAIVATDVGGTREIFPEQVNAAELIARDDPGALAETVVSLLEDNARGEQLGQAARQRAEQAFDVHAAAEGLIRHYRDALS